MLQAPKKNDESLIGKRLKARAKPENESRRTQPRRIVRSACLGGLIQLLRVAPGAFPMGAKVSSSKAEMYALDVPRVHLEWAKSFLHRFAGQVKMECRQENIHIFSLWGPHGKEFIPKQESPRNPWFVMMQRAVCLQGRLALLSEHEKIDFFS